MAASSEDRADWRRFLSSRQLFSWEDVRAIMEKGELEKLGRSLAQQEIYDKFRSETLCKWGSVSDYLLASKFGFDTQTSADTGKLVVSRRPSEKDDDRLVLAANDFPYYFAEGIGHHLLWKIGSPLLPEEIDSTVQRMIAAEPNYSDHVTYINPPYLKSIPDIDHAHILIYAPPTNSSPTS